jgi:hypothetical protein
MKRRPRIYYSDSQKALMWERWKQGWTLQEIDKLFDRAHSSIHRILAETGGIRHAQRYGPQPHCRFPNEKRSREPSWRGHRFGHRCTTGTSTIDNQPGDQAQWWAPQLPGEPGRCSCLGPSEAPKCCKLVASRALAQTVAHKLRVLWSPQQIAGWLKQTYPCDESHHVSHETIYRSLFIQARGALKKELLEHFRRTFRRADTLHGMRAGQVAATSGVWERYANRAQICSQEANNPQAALDATARQSPCRHTIAPHLAQKWHRTLHFVFKKTMRVLVVEDDPALRLGISRMLQAEGWQVDIVTDGEYARFPHRQRRTTTRLCWIWVCLGAAVWKCSRAGATRARI